MIKKLISRFTKPVVIRWDGEGSYKTLAEVQGCFLEGYFKVEVRCYSNRSRAYIRGFLKEKLPGYLFRKVVIQ